MYKFKYKLKKIQNIKKYLKTKGNFYNKLPFKTNNLYMKMYKKKIFFWKQLYLIMYLFNRDIISFKKTIYKKWFLFNQKEIFFFWLKILKQLYKKCKTFFKKLKKRKFKFFYKTNKKKILRKKKKFLLKNFSLKKKKIYKNIIKTKIIFIFKFY